MTNYSASDSRLGPSAEKHHRVSDLAALWRVHPKTISRIFSKEPGVLRLPGKRSVILIPASVAARVHERLSQQALKAPLPAGHPLKVIRFRDLNARMPKKA